MKSWLDMLAGRASLLAPLALVSLVAVMLVPLPPLLLDLLIVANMALAAVILLTTFQVRSPLEFSVFPSLLLAATLYRLVLNIASTRLILTADAPDAPGATAVAGRVIQSFGDFVAGGSIVLGFVLFLILIVVQFVVITKGAMRISEVAARFTLDGMPGKQMAIDADLGAGAIDESEARARREEIGREADFYGAMDGASKFVRGDAIAGLVITLVNITGGLVIGISRGWPMGDTLATFTKLTIGDGLTAQVPAFITALAAGLIVTRSASRGDLGGEMAGQLTSQPQALGIAAAVIAALALLGLPAVPLLVIAGVLAGLAVLATRRQTPTGTANTAPAPGPDLPPAVEALELEIGYGLVEIADVAQGGDLLDRISMLRRELAGDMGLVLPSVRIRDDVQLPADGYRIKLRGHIIAQGHLAHERGDRAAMLTAQLAGAVSMHAAELLSRQEMDQLIAQLRGRAPRLVEEVVGPLVKPAELRKLLQDLLGEQVPIRDLELIVEAIADCPASERDRPALTEHVRKALRRTLCEQYATVDTTTGRRRLYCITLAQELDDWISQYIDRGPRSAPADLPPAQAQRIAQAIAAGLRPLTQAGHPPLILVAGHVRRTVRGMLEPVVPQVAVLSFAEVDRAVEVEVVGQVSAEPMRTSSSPTGHRLQEALN